MYFLTNFEINLALNVFSHINFDKRVIPGQMHKLEQKVITMVIMVA
jgi:hypothetical protein